MATLIIDHPPSVQAPSAETYPIGDEYFEFFRQHAWRVGLNVASDHIVPGRAHRGQIRQVIATMRESGADSIMHLGYGLTFFETLKATAEVMERTGWEPPRTFLQTFSPNENEWQFAVAGTRGRRSVDGNVRRSVRPAAP